ncbi:MAG TPA: hypothetical protein VNO26_01025 [Candidatus Limnocylindria bacterium]|nr:hypothetical protein [Candidatus Limnocylindria bacterium]
MERNLHPIVLAATGVLLAGVTARAANVGVLGTKLIIVDKGAKGAKAVFVAKDPAVDKGTGTDITTIGVTLDVRYDNGTDSSTSGAFLAPSGSANWVVNKTTVAKYVNKPAPTGGATKVTVIKPGKLVKLVAKSLGDTPIDILSQSGAANGTARTAYRITDSSTGFDSTFCTTFGGCAWKSIAQGTGAKLVCKGGAADPTCGGPQPPASILLGALTATPGRFNYNLMLGLPGANAACNSNFPGTHACTYQELQAAEAAGDLVGLQDIASQAVTSFWAIDNSQPPLQQCQDDVGSFQNWEYGTAHTLSRGQRVTLNNGTGVLGPLQSNVQCNIAGNSWVGCCL